MRGAAETAVVFLAAALVIVFGDRDLQYILEPDFPAMWMEGFRRFFESLDPVHLPPSDPYPYFDGGNIIYAWCMALLEVLPGVDGLAPGLSRKALLAVNVVNLTAHVLATWIFYRTTTRLAPSIPVAFLLALAFTICPQVVEMGQLRIDRLILLPLAGVWHASVRIALGEDERANAILLGAWMGLLAACKISGIVFLVLPIGAFLVRRTLRFSGWAATAAAVVWVPIMLRLIFQTDLLIYWVESARVVELWTSVFSREPLLYYNVELFFGYGPLFLPLFAVALALVVRGPKLPISWFLIGALVFFSLLGMAAFKYPRGGYHLVPIYLSIIAWGAKLGAERFVAARRAIAPILVVPLISAALIYTREATAAWHRPQSIELTRRRPRAWLEQHVPPKSRVCVMQHSLWAVPPISDLDYQIVSAPFGFPYLDRAAMGRFHPPSIDSLNEVCDLIIFNDFHEAEYLKYMRTMGYPALAGEWEEFYRTLRRRYPPVVFESEYPAYYVKRVEIFVIGTAGR